MSGNALTGYTVHSVFEDFTWDKKVTMSGAADDWVYEHLGVYGWTTEFWDVIHAATGTKQSTHFWYVGPTEAEEVAVLRWAEEHGHDGVFVDWYPFDHPQLGPVELGGWDHMRSWTNPPLALLAAEVRPHAEFAVHQALASPALAVAHTAAVALGADTWRVELGIANTGWLPTDVTAHARKSHMVLPLVATVEGADVLGGPARLELGQLEGRSSARFSGRNDGTPTGRSPPGWCVPRPAARCISPRRTNERVASRRRWCWPAERSGRRGLGATDEDARQPAGVLAVGEGLHTRLEGVAIAGRGLHQAAAARREVVHDVRRVGAGAAMSITFRSAR
ncbi:MAG: hypothetical protein R2713_07450 [Ilumatobacteraceae bacterium]